MENFVLYHVILKQDGMTMYKGRKKNTISYVAVSCIDKKKRVKVTNHVRLFYEIDNEYVAKFLEWYETSNHLWLVTELCVGGSLMRMLEEDGKWPENIIMKFGMQLIRGLHHLHSNGILFLLWHPSKIVLDGQSRLKYFDFSDSRKINEDIDELVVNFFSGLNISDKEVRDIFDYNITTPYMAPELLTNPATSPVIDFSVDIWGLGCIFYEMLVGQPPFVGQDSKELQRNILHSPLILPQSYNKSHRVSPALLDMLDSMLQKQPTSRLSLTQLIQHSFWQNQLLDLLKLNSHSHERASLRTPLHQHHHKTPTGDSTASESTVDEVSFTMHVASGDKASHGDHDPNASNSIHQLNVNSVHNPSNLSSQRLVESRSKSVATYNRTNSVSGGGINKDYSILQGDGKLDFSSLVELVLTNSTSGSPTQKRGLEDYQKWLKDTRIKYDPKLLPIPPLSSAKIKNLRASDRERHLRQLESLLRLVEKGPPTQKRMHLINYTTSVALASIDCCDFMLSLESSHNTSPNSVALIIDIARHAKSSPNQDLAQKSAQLIAVVVYYSTNICTHQQLTSLNELLAVLVELLRDNFRCNKLKFILAVALGEVLIKITQCSVSSQVAASVTTPTKPEDDNITEDVPTGLGLAFTLLNRCLHRTEEVSLNMVVSRTIELIFTCGVISSTNAVASAACTVETFQQLYNCYTHATTDQLRCATSQSMSLIIKHDCGMFDKIGTTVQQGLLLLEGGIAVANNTAPVPVQQSLLDMLIIALNNATSFHNNNTSNNISSCVAFIRKLVSSANNTTQQRSSLISTLASLLDCSQSNQIRAKTLLVLLLLPNIVTSGVSGGVDIGILRDVFMDIRLLAHLNKRGAMSSRAEEFAALNHVVINWVVFLSVVALPVIIGNAQSALEAIYNRRHPSTSQLKALQSNLPPLEVAVALLNNATIKERVDLLNLSNQLSRLIQLVEYVDSVGPNVIGGSDTAPNLLMHVLSMSDALIGSPADSNQIQMLLIPMASLITSTANPDIRIIGLKMCADIINCLATKLTPNDDAATQQPLDTTNQLNILQECLHQYLLTQTDRFLQDRDPSPAHFLRIINRYLQIRPEETLDSITNENILSQHVLQLLLDHQQQHRIMAGAVQESLLMICSIAQINTEPLHHQMLESDLIVILRDVMLDVGEAYYHNVEMVVMQPTSCKTTELMHSALETMSIVAKLISDIVRQALQCRKTSAGSHDNKVALVTAQAEELLGVGRPLTEIVGLLCQNIYCEHSNLSDSDIVELSVKLLNQIVSLYGGQQIQHGLDKENISCLCNAVISGESKHRRTLLRIIKRLLASGGEASLETQSIIRQMINSSKLHKEKDSVCITLLDEINKFIKVA